MISHSDFIKRFAAATGWSEVDLRHRHRWLREDRQFKGGRGGRGGAGAAQADPAMAVRLMLAMALTAKAKDAPAAVRLAWNWRAELNVDEHFSPWDCEYHADPAHPTKRNFKVGRVPKRAISLPDQLRSIILPLDGEYLLDGIWPDDEPDLSGPQVDVVLGTRLSDVLLGLLQMACTDQGIKLLRSSLDRVSFSRSDRVFTLRFRDRRFLQQREVPGGPPRGRIIPVTFGFDPDLPLLERERLESAAGWGDADRDDDLPAPITLDIRFPRNIFELLANLTSLEDPAGSGSAN